MQVLDIGCGGGLGCEFLAQQGAEVTGIDLSCESINAAKEHAKQHYLNINYYCGCAETLLFEANTFDVVWCCDVLEHVTDYRKVFAEAYRVLKSKGFFLFDTINRTFKSKIIMIWLLENILKQLPQGLHDWDKFIKPQELLSSIQEVGFKNSVIKGFDLTGEMSFETLKNIVSKGLTTSSTQNHLPLFTITINEDTSVWDIGQAIKL